MIDFAIYDCLLTNTLGVDIYNVTVHTMTAYPRETTFWGAFDKKCNTDELTTPVWAQCLTKNQTINFGYKTMFLKDPIQFSFTYDTK
eukprot:gene11605-13548_t